MQTKPFRIGTRGSPLALAQAHEARDRLMAAHGLPEEMFEIVVLTTTGDRITDRSLAEIGGKGLFTQELEEKLALGELDFAVHSAKDMPTVLPEGLYLSAYLPREDIRDAVVGRTAPKLIDLPHGATVGSSSLRRQALIRRMRPDINVITFRGLVDTRLRKLAEGQVDATLLALAGLKRLGKVDVLTDILDPDTFPPAPAQGAIAIESRIGDERIDNLLAAINDPATFDAVSCERAFLGALDGSCRTPIGGSWSTCRRSETISGTAHAPPSSGSRTSRSRSWDIPMYSRGTAKRRWRSWRRCRSSRCRERTKVCSCRCVRTGCGRRACAVASSRDD